MIFYHRISTATNEKDVENAYRTELSHIIPKGEITSPYGTDGVLKYDDVHCLLEFKYDPRLKNRIEMANIIAQCIFYLKKFEANGQKLPTTAIIGDINECFALHTNCLIKYLSFDLDWKTAPSSAHRNNPNLVRAIVDDENIAPFVFNVDRNFRLESIIEIVNSLTNKTIKKVRITSHNVTSIFEYFNSYVLGSKCKLTTNEKANLFMQIIINPNENYLNPKKKNILISKSFGSTPVVSEMFTSFFSHFEDELYSPKEKEALTSLVDRLVEDETRRKKGEFFTPTAFVDLAHEYVAKAFGEDWKERFVVWDNSCGTTNLTRDYKFKELYLSTLEQSDLDTAEQMGYNPEAVKFQFDFLNDSDDKLPKGLKTAIDSGKEILFLINPPYATAGNMGVIEGDSKAGVAKTAMNDAMIKEGWGKSAQNLYAQFLYRITNIQEKNGNVKIAIFAPPLYMSGNSYQSFRERFFSKFTFTNGFLFEASHFSDVANGWGISFCTLDSGKNENKFILDVIQVDSLNLLSVDGNKEFYSTDNCISGSSWIKGKTKNAPKIQFPKFSSYLSVKDSNTGNELIEGSIGSFMNHNNNVSKNTIGCSIFTGGLSATWGMNYITHQNIFDVFSLFTARKTILPNWINCKDEYLAPNESHPLYKQFQLDSIIYSLFNNSSQQSSLRNIEYKGKQWDIKNEFFWLSKERMMELANESNFDDLYRDAKNGDNRYVYKLLFESNIYNELSDDARQILDMATALLEKSIAMREVMHDAHPEYHLASFDCGYAQLKLVWKEYYAEEFKSFRTAYNAFGDRMRPLVYELGFLKN